MQRANAIAILLSFACLAQARHSGASVARRSLQSRVTSGAVIPWGSWTVTDYVPTFARSSILEIAAGNAHSIALTRTGKVVAWGFSEWGATDVPKEAQSGIVQIYAGSYYNLAVNNRGKIIAWGSYTGGTIEAKVPERLQNPGSPIIALAVGGNTNMALKQDGSVYIWGMNDEAGQTPGWGRGDFRGLGGSDKPSAIATTGPVACYVQTGQLVCFDVNPTQSITLPTEITSGVIDIVAARKGEYMLIEKDDGTLWQWKKGQKARQVYDGSDGKIRGYDVGYDQGLVCTDSGSYRTWSVFSETDVPDLVRVPEGLDSCSDVAVSGGMGYYLSVDTSGNVKAWGKTITDVWRPSSASKGISKVAVGDNHALALTTAGKVIGWGDNAHGQSAVPSSLSKQKVIAIAASGDNSVALTSKGRVVVWGDDAFTQLQVPAAARSGITQIAAGPGYVAAFNKKTGTVTVWGSSKYWNYQPENGKVVSIAAAKEQIVYVLRDGSVRVQGFNGKKFRAPKLVAVGAVFGGSDSYAVILNNPMGGSGSRVSIQGPLSTSITIPSTVTARSVALCDGYAVVLTDKGRVIGYGTENGVAGRVRNGVAVAASNTFAVAVGSLARA